MSGAHSEDRYGAHASREQEIAHLDPPCDSAAGDRRKSTRSAAGRHPLNGKTSGSVSQRNGDIGATSAYVPLGLRAYVRTPVTPTYLKPEATGSLFPRLMDRNHHFWRLLSQRRLTPPSISTRRTISSVSCANEAFHPDHSCIGGDLSCLSPPGTSGAPWRKSN